MESRGHKAAITHTRRVLGVLTRSRESGTRRNASDWLTVHSNHEHNTRRLRLERERQIWLAIRTLHKSVLPFCHYYYHFAIIFTPYMHACVELKGAEKEKERKTGWLRQTETEYETSRQWDTLFPMSSDNIIPQHKVETLNFVGTFAFWQTLASWLIGKQALFGPSKRRLTPLIEITGTYRGQCQCLVPISGPYESTWFFLLPVLPPELGATFPCLSSSYIFKCASICM